MTRSSRLAARVRRPAWLLLLPLLPFASARAESDADAPAQLATVDVIGVAAARGAELPEALSPYNVQNAGAEAIERAAVLDVTDFLDRQLGGVSLGPALGNPLQPEVQFRGYGAGPLLGAPEGLSVYIDGVRVNELFGDTVNWDLIPEEAIAHVSLVSGADPLFGLNTLGGALLIQTKTGFTDPGAHAETYAGSFGRSEATLAAGGNDGRLGYYVLANHLEEQGWRDASDSHAGDVFGTVSWHTGAATLDLTLAHAETRLAGNGAQALAALAAAPASVFTAPDVTQNVYSGVTVQGSYAPDAATTLSATAFLRQVDTRATNGDASAFAPCAAAAAILCDGDTPVRDQYGATVAASLDAVENVGVRKQRGSGVALQAVFKQPLAGRDNQFVLGLEDTVGRVNYASQLELATVQPLPRDARFSHAIVPAGGLIVPAASLAAHIAERAAGVYASDTWSPTDALALTLSARDNRTVTSIADRSGAQPALDGEHAFARLNPALGATYRLAPTWSAYAGYSESARAPTPVELTCASPAAPCRLPNDFVADPPLHAVVARGLEAGLRGEGSAAGAQWHWQFGVFRTINAHDIVFQATGGAQSNAGFFANVGATRRQGIESSLRARLFQERLQLHASASLTDATYRSAFLERSAHHPFADPASGLIAVVRGDRLPGVPRATAKIGADVTPVAQLTFGADMVYDGARRLRGDEANRLAPLGGYALVALRARWRVVEHGSVFARVENAFDRRYAAFGTLGDARALFPHVTDPRFETPGAPRAGWLGFDLDW